MIEFDGQNHYQEDLTLRAAKTATKLSYRGAPSRSRNSRRRLSRSTIHRRVKRFGGRMREFIHDVAGNEAGTVMADGTKRHSQEDGVSLNNVRLTLNRAVVRE